MYTTGFGFDFGRDSAFGFGSPESLSFFDMPLLSSSESRFEAIEKSIMANERMI